MRQLLRPYLYVSSIKAAFIETERIAICQGLEGREELKHTDFLGTRNNFRNIMYDLLTQVHNAVLFAWKLLIYIYRENVITIATFRVIIMWGDRDVN